MIKKIIALTLIAMIGITQDWSIPLRCPVEVDQPAQLDRLTWSQGSTPLMAIEHTRRGRPQNIDTNTVVSMIIGPSSTSDYFAIATNTSATAKNYYIQWPTIGTNTTSGAWWYTVYFEREGRRYWTGNGELWISETTSTTDGLKWQEVISCGELGNIKATQISNSVYHISIITE